MANPDRIRLAADRSINVVHPIPADWLREDLLPNERDRVREHVDSVLGGAQTQTPFTEALRGTIANLNTVNIMGTATRAIPARHHGGTGFDSLPEDFESMPTGLLGSVQSPSRSVRFSDRVQTDRVSRDPRELGPHSPQSSSPTPRSILRSPGHSRSNSNNSGVEFSVTSRRDVAAPSLPSAYLNELADLDAQVDEIDDAINGKIEIDEGDETELPKNETAGARSTTRQL